MRKKKIVLSDLVKPIKCNVKKYARNSIDFIYLYFASLTIIFSKACNYKEDME